MSVFICDKDMLAVLDQLVFTSQIRLIFIIALKMVHFGTWHRTTRVNTQLALLKYYSKHSQHVFHRI